MRRGPVEGFDQCAVRGDELRRIARAARADDAGDLALDDGIERVEHFDHRQPGAVAAVQEEVFGRAFNQFFERGDMCGGEVGDMDIVADAAAVGGRVIDPEYIDMANRRLKRELGLFHQEYVPNKRFYEQAMQASLFESHDPDLYFTPE